jgi:hypothetical protein
VPVCIATPMADVSSIEPCNLRATPARSVSSGAMDAVARMFKTIRLSRRGPMLRADVCTPGAWEGHIELVDIGQRVCRACQARLLPANATPALPLIADSERTSHHVRSVPQPGSCTAVRFHNGMPLDECGTKPVIFHRNNRKAAIQVICLAAVLSLDPSSMLDRDNTRSVFRNSKLQWQQRPPRLRLPPLAVSFDVQRRRNSWGLTVVPHALVRYQRTMRDRLLVTSQLNRKPQT